MAIFFYSKLLPDTSQYPNKCKLIHQILARNGLAYGMVDRSKTRFLCVLMNSCNFIHTSTCTTIFLTLSRIRLICNLFTLVIHMPLTVWSHGGLDQQFQRITKLTCNVIWGSRTRQFPWQICFVLIYVFIFHFRSYLCISWNPGEARGWGPHSKWTQGVGVDVWLGVQAGGKGSLRGRGHDKGFLQRRPGWRTSWAFPWWLSDNPQLWGEGRWGVLVKSHKRTCRTRHFQYVNYMNC